jgi:glycosyltransferase involved in cell wall biosynthesis
MFPIDRIRTAPEDSAAPGTPEISVVVPSHERALRLRWLLNSLEEQDLAPDRWELIVVHDSVDETEQTIAEHPLTADGRLRHRRLEAGTGTPARQRNVGWRMARAPLVAFIDDDCRAEPAWLRALLDRAVGALGSVVQGRTRPDPFEADVMRAPHYRTLEVEPPGPFGQTCNILYPRELLDRLEGFDETLPTAAGEDTDLLMRARAAGAGCVGEPNAVVNHAVEEFTLAGMIRLSWKWRHLPFVTSRHPEIRALFPLGRFWRPTHIWLPVAVAGAALGSRHRGAWLLAVPYVQLVLKRRGSHPRARLRAAAELPGRVCIDAAEISALAWGSVRYRTLFL